MVVIVLNQFKSFMTKKTTPPKFLHAKLNVKTAALVKKHMPTFLDKAKRDHNGKYLEPM